MRSDELIWRNASNINRHSKDIWPHFNRNFMSRWCTETQKEHFEYKDAFSLLYRVVSILAEENDAQFVWLFCLNPTLM